MKLAILFISTLMMTSSAFATDFFSSMDKVFTNFELCGADTKALAQEQKENEVKFKTLYKVMKLADSKNKKTSVTAPDVSVNSVTLLDTKSKLECTMHIDGYDGRCYYIECSK